MKTNRSKLVVLAVIAAIAAVCQWGFHHPGWAQLIITVAGAVIAISMLLGMVKKLRRGDYGVDLLAIIAITAALAVSEYWAAMVILLMLIGGDALEDYANQKARGELKTLLDNTPRTAHRLVGAKQQSVSVNDLQVGDQVKVLPGELVPVDGRVIAGRSTVNESSLTGESLPLTKQAGDELLSGSVNGDAALTMKVEKRAEDSQYQQLVALIKEADQQPAHFVRLADRYAIPFTIISLIIGAVAWLVSKDPVRFAQVMVVASPCPLILAAPVAFVSGMSRSSADGIVVKSGDVIEKLATARSAAFDKTGTLTSGQLTVSDVVPVPGVDQSTLLQLVASAEQGSNHILAHSIVHRAQDDGLKLDSPSKVEEVTAQGVVAEINGRQVKAGKLAFVAPGQDQQLADTTAVYAAVDGHYYGRIELADQLRLEAPATIDELRDAGIKTIIMVTGDNETIAQRIAQKIGITKVFANLLPKDKIARLKDLPESERPSIMVGDGVNDAPVLKVADVGIAMGARGSTAASESADVVILTDNLHKVANAVKIAEDTLAIAKHAVLIGIFVCIGLMLIASTGIVPTIIGAFLQEVVDTVCILWGLRARHGSRQLNE